MLFVLFMYLKFIFIAFKLFSLGLRMLDQKLQIVREQWLNHCNLRYSVAKYVLTKVVIIGYGSVCSFIGLCAVEMSLFCDSKVWAG